MQDSNLRHFARQANALPAELILLINRRNPSAGLALSRYSLAVSLAGAAVLITSFWYLQPSFRAFRVQSSRLLLLFVFW